MPKLEGSFRQRLFLEGAIRLTLSGTREIVAVSAKEYAEATQVTSLQSARDSVGQLDETKLKEVKAAGVEVFYTSVAKALDIHVLAMSLF